MICAVILERSLKRVDDIRYLETELESGLRMGKSSTTHRSLIRLQIVTKRPRKSIHNSFLKPPWIRKALCDVFSMWPKTVAVMEISQYPAVRCLHNDAAPAYFKVNGLHGETLSVKEILNSSMKLVPGTVV
jgi:hypothetical protein